MSNKSDQYVIYLKQCSLSLYYKKITVFLEVLVELAAFFTQHGSETLLATYVKSYTALKRHLLRSLNTIRRGNTTGHVRSNTNQHWSAIVHASYTRDTTLTCMHYLWLYTSWH